MDYRVYDVCIGPQLSRLFSSTQDDNAVYLLEIGEDKTPEDLLACLNFRPLGGGFYFDVSRLNGIATLLGTGTDCVRTIANNSLTFSRCNINCIEEGTPTHVILGGIVPFVVDVGKDVQLLYPDSGTVVDRTGEGSVVTVSRFAIKLLDIEKMIPSA